MKNLNFFLNNWLYFSLVCDKINCVESFNHKGGFPRIVKTKEKFHIGG